MANKFLSLLILLQIINLFGMEKIAIESKKRSFQAICQVSEFLNLPQEIQQMILRFDIESITNHQELINRLKLLRLVCKGLKGRIDNIIFAKYMHEQFERLSKVFFTSQELQYPDFKLNIEPEPVGTIFELAKLRANLKFFNLFKSEVDRVKFNYSIFGNDIGYSGPSVQRFVKENDFKALEIMFLNYSDWFLEDEWHPFEMMWQAIDDTNLEMLEFLLKKGCKINKQRFINGCFKHFSINRTTLVSPLHWAVFRQEDDNPDLQSMVQFLIDKGANPNIVDQDGKTPLMYVGGPNLAKILIGGGADVKIQCTKFHRSALFRAIDINSVDLLVLLIENGTDIKAMDIGGEIPLFYAARIQQLKMVDALLKNGANINSQDHKGNTILHEVITKLNTQIILCLDEKSLKLIELFVNNPDINLSLTNFEGKAALDCLKEGVKHDEFDYGDNLKTALKIFEQAIENKKNKK